MTWRALPGAVVLMSAIATLGLASDEWPLASASARAEAGRGAGTRRPDMTDAARAAASLPRLHSLLVSRRGELILEHYAKGVRPTRLANVKSASKSIISALVGIALARNHIKSVNEPIVTYFPELRRDADPRKQKITVEDLLTMRSGLESTSGSNYGEWVRSRNWVKNALDRPMVSEPGTDMEYSTGSSHLLSAILTKTTKMSTWQFAQTALMRPIGVTLAAWTRDPQGIFMGGNEMLMTPRQMVAFGGLYLNEGRHNGKQILPASWVATSCEPRTSSRWDSDRRYGYGWWMRDLGGRQTCFAWGFGGQVHLRVPRSRSGRRGDVIDKRGRRASRLPPQSIRSDRARGDRADRRRARSVRLQPDLADAVVSGFNRDEKARRSAGPFQLLIDSERASELNARRQLEHARIEIQPRLPEYGTVHGRLIAVSSLFVEHVVQVRNELKVERSWQADVLRVVQVQLPVRVATSRAGWLRVP